MVLPRATSTTAALTVVTTFNTRNPKDKAHILSVFPLHLNKMELPLVPHFSQAVCTVEL